MIKKEQLKQNPFFLSDEDIDWVYGSLKDMTLEEKVGQLFCLCIFDPREEAVDHVFGILKPGGTMYRPVTTKEAVTLTNMLAQRSKIPMLIAANFEKGADGGVTDGSGVGTPLEIAATGDVSMAGKLGTVCAREGAAAGFNWAFAPIIDIDTNFRNPITNTRTFGSDPARVRDMGVAYVKAVQAGGMAASIKHFPGDGQDERDQHLVTSVNDMDCETWDATYGAAYQASIDAGALTVMVGHIMQPAYTRMLNPSIKDEDMMPATLSPELMEGLLRGKLGFNGLIVTDATSMGGFTIPMAREKAVPYSIACGADMFLFAKDTQEDFDFMMKGVQDGVITPERLEDALVRILALKAALKLHKNPLPTLAAAEKAVGVPEHKKWAEECADRAITLVKEQKGVLPLSPEKTKRMLFIPIEPDTSGAMFSMTSSAKDTFREMLEAEGFDVTEFSPNMGMEGMMAPTSATLEKYDVIVYLSNLATKSNQTVVRIEWAQPMGANLPAYVQQIPTVFISVANPYHLLDVPRVKTFINCYHSSPVVLKALMEKLMGRSEFVGINPVDPFCGKWDAHLS
ncbi:glycoside hydrolase family 3 protein [Eubacteriales bacterium OttesenSCG-928-A19]|nr:glycoside hydrolase family 3 protein [Eubacteriales bacterium OttesenSCG-928-A19]